MNWNHYRSDTGLRDRLPSLTNCSLKLFSNQKLRCGKKDSKPKSRMARFGTGNPPLKFQGFIRISSIEEMDRGIEGRCGSKVIGYGDH